MQSAITLIQLAFHKVFIEEMAKMNTGDMHIEWGSLPFGTPAGWASWADGVVAIAQWLQGIVDVYGITAKFMIYNEEEFPSHRSNSAATSINRSSNVVTVTMPFEHKLDAGMDIEINGSSVISSSNYTIATVPTPTTFTINSSGTNGSGGGNIKYSITTTRQMARKVAGLIKAAIDPVVTIPIVVSTAQGQDGTQFYFEKWKQEGLGPVDEVHLNIYSNSNETDPQANWVRFKDEVMLAYELFGEKLSITEWNTYENDDAYSALNKDITRRRFYLKLRKRLIDRLGIYHYYFNYRKPGVLAEKYPYNNNNGGGIRPSFYYLRNKRSPYIERVPR